MLINCNPLTFYWCAQICNIHKLQPIRIPNSSSTVFISILFLYTAHNALPFLQSRLVHCMFQRSSSIDYDQAYYCRTHKMSTSPHDYQQKVAIIRLHIGGKPDPWVKPFLWRVEYFRTGTMKDRLWLQFNIFLVFVYWKVYFRALQ